MTRLLRSAAAVVAASLLAVLGIVGIDATPAFALCNSSGCNGRDPHTTGCDAGAYKLDEFTVLNAGSLRVRLMYSPRCNAAWALSTVGAPGMIGSRHWLVLYVYRSGSGGTAHIAYWKKITNASNDTGPSGTQRWTPMHTFSTVYVQACLKNSAEDGPCTDRR